MALKKNLTKEEHAKLSKDIQKEYKAEGEDGFILDLEGGFEDTTALKSAKDHEKKARKDAELKAKQAEDRIAELETEREEVLKGNVPKGDVDKLEKSYQAKMAKREAELSGTIAHRETALRTLLVDNTATALASKLSNSPALLVPIIRSRLTAEMKEGTASTRVLDAQGQPSAATLEDLEKEIIANDQFKPILIASKASGGGANGGGKTGGAGGKSVNRATFDAMDHGQRAEHAKAGGTVTD